MKVEDLKKRRAELEAEIQKNVTVINQLQAGIQQANNNIGNIARENLLRTGRIDQLTEIIKSIDVLPDKKNSKKA
jgi:hypothetical protein